MRLDLALLKQMHPLLPATTAAEYGYRAALGLERHGHESGAQMAARLDDTEHDATLAWTRSRSDNGEQLDRHRITEDAAEAISLALVSVALDWVVRRRGQRGESIDWILRDRERNLVALEVSGIDRGDGGRRLREKTIQAGRATVAAQRAACVVELAAPRADLASATGQA